MPPTSSHHPETRQSHRSRLSSPYQLPLRGDAGSSRSPAPVPFPLRPSDHLCVPEQDVPSATATSRSPVLSKATHTQNSTSRLGVDRTSEESRGRPSQVSWNTVDSNSTHILYPRSLATELPVDLPHLSDSMDSIHSLHPPLPRLSSSSLSAPSQQSTNFERQSAPPGEDTLLPHYQGPEMFRNAHNFTMTRPNFIEGNIMLTNNFNSSNNFMEKLLKETIPGAASDSSARYPPPRCHPGTRLAILERCLHFIAHCDGQTKMRWVVGAAGVGKTAIMQSVADTPQLPVKYNASVFFSINGSNDGTKTIMTLSYQFAAKSKLYRQIIEHAITDDPYLLQSSMPVQFEKFIVQPFIHNPDLNSAGRVLIIIDGVDECKRTATEVDLLRLISSFCIEYPSSPIVWLIASRPEPHITSFLSRAKVIPAYEKEEIAVDTDEARADVERFLREELTEIREGSDSLDPHWPREQDLWKLAGAAGGLFAYAHTVIRFIGDSTVGDPVSQLSVVLNVIDKHSMPEMPREEHPMALLDALYDRILSNVPRKIMINTRKLLLALASEWDYALESRGYPKPGKTFVVLGNWLGMTADEAYAAVNCLRSVLSFPKRHEAHKEPLKPFHKSFIDYLFRSGFFPDIKREAAQMFAQCAFRVLKEVPNGTALGYDDGDIRYGRLARQRGADGKISITWPTDEGIAWQDDRTRVIMYKLAVGEVVAGVKREDEAFSTESSLKLLTTRFVKYSADFAFYQLSKLALDKSRRYDFMRRGILTQISAKTLGMYTISSRRRQMGLQFRRPITATTLPDPWNSFCRHEREGQWEEGQEQNWTTVASSEGSETMGCIFCSARLEDQVKDWIIRSPNHTIPLMFTSTSECFVELQFVDLEDGVSEWTYSVWMDLDSEERKRLARSTI